MAILRRSLVLVVLGFGLLVVTSASIDAVIGVDQVGGQVTELEEQGEDAPGLGVIVGTPEAGPEPEDAGDRGGFAQLGLAIVLFVAIGFIASRVAKGARASP